MVQQEMGNNFDDKNGKASMVIGGAESAELAEHLPTLEGILILPM